MVRPWKKNIKKPPSFPTKESWFVWYNHSITELCRIPTSQSDVNYTNQKGDDVMKRHIPVQIEWHPDPAQAVPVYRQILEWMYGKMESGEWPAGTRLPSQREMARHFQVNRSTLNQALKPLLEAGVLQGRGSQGTVIASTAWSLRLPVQPDWNRYMTAGYFRANQEVVQAINTLEFDDRLVRLGTGELDPRLFPQDAFRQTLRDVADAITSLGYVEPLGMPALRQALAGYARKRNSIVAPSSILITSGALQGLQLISAGLLRGGATVYVEDPTYVKSLQVFQSAHLRLCGLPMDDQGLSLEALEKHLRQSSDRGNSVLYTIPTNHNPTGRTLSRRRRIQLLELCSRYDLPIIEDGAYEELTFDGTPPPSLKSLDPGGRVLYLGSVSKSLAPGLRIGWMIAPEPVVQRLGDVKMQIDYGASSLSQQVLARFLTSGRYEQYLDGLRCELQRRCQAACQSLSEVFADMADWQVPQGGFYIWLTFRSRLPMELLFRKAVSAGVLINPGDIYSSRHTQSLRLSYAYTTPEEFRQAVSQLAVVVRSLEG